MILKIFCAKKVLQKLATLKQISAGVDVMITIFCEKIGVFLKYQCYL
jgi:hypothetical protein